MVLTMATRTYSQNWRKVWLVALVVAFVFWGCSMVGPNYPTYNEAAQYAPHQATRGTAREEVLEEVLEAAHQAVREAARETVNEAVREAAHQAVREAVREAAHEAVREAAHQAVREATHQAVREAAREAEHEAAHVAVSSHQDSRVEGEAVPKEKASVKVRVPVTPPPPAAPLVVLVLSSMPRGGSTLLTELLAAIQDSVVMFEPLWYIEKNRCYQDEACVQGYMADVFSCTFKDDFENWLKSKGMFFYYFNEQARHCLRSGEGKDTCLKEIDLRALCKGAPVLVVKVVRCRMAWMHTMLHDSSINLKVIHLTRDPRGSLNSIAKFRWNKDPHSRCSDLEDDLLTYDKIRQVFPSKVMQVRYENLSLTPQSTTSNIFSFLFGNATLPDPVTTFLKQHMLTGTKKGGSMSTVKNSTEAFQAWRFNISDEYLKAVEAEPTCLRAIKRMGHAVFGSQAAARDTTKPLVINTT